METVQQARSIYALIFIICLVVFAGCGDGGGGSNSPAANNANWDTLVWDQNQWQ